LVEKLAIEGGEPVRKQPWPERVQVDEEELKAVTDVVRRSMGGRAMLWRYSSPSLTEEFEAEFARFHGVKYAVASTSGTSSIHVALASAMMEPGGEVVTSPITDVGTITPILFQNLIPVFADVDPGTLNMDPSSVEKRITERTRAIIAVHIAGQPCEMDRLMRLAEEHGLVLVEDCAQAHAALYKGRLAGSMGRLGCFSLMTGKHITSGGEGGMTITDEEELWRNAKSFADKGKSFWPERRSFALIGLNYRMTELQAAMGLVQLRKLSGIVSARRRLCENLRASMSHLKATRFMKVIEGAEPSYWFCHLHVSLDALKVGVDRVAEALNGEGIPVGARYIRTPVYEYPFIAERATFGKSQHPWSCSFYGRRIEYSGSCPMAERALGDVLTLNIHECCTEREVEDMVSALEKVEANYLR